MHRKEENITENRTTQKTIYQTFNQWRKLSLFNNIILWADKNEGRNLKSEKSQDYSQKAQRNSTSANFISVLVHSDLQRHYLYVYKQSTFYIMSACSMEYLLYSDNEYDLRGATNHQLSQPSTSQTILWPAYRIILSLFLTLSLCLSFYSFLFSKYLQYRWIKG